MVRGYTTFTCSECGHKFRGLDAEWCCTVYTAPVECPNCHSMRTYPRSLFGLNKFIYKKIWDANEK